jgi:hypothetical protein
LNVTPAAGTSTASVAPGGAVTGAAPFSPLDALCERNLAGWTPLEEAYAHGLAASVAWLLATLGGRACGAPRRDGLTGPHLAAAGGYGGVLRAAAEAGVDVGAADAAGRTPCQVARALGPQLPRLIDKITSAFALESLLAGVFAAPDLARAQGVQGQLAAHESVVTPEGIWLGPNWVQVPGRRQNDDSVLVRERRLEELRRQEQQLAEGVAVLEGEQGAAHSALQALEAREAELSRHINTRNGEATELRGRAQRHETELAQTLNRIQELGRQRSELATRAQTQHVNRASRGREGERTLGASSGARSSRPLRRTI